MEPGANARWPSPGCGGARPRDLLQRLRLDERPFALDEGQDRRENRLGSREMVLGDLSDNFPHSHARIALDSA